MILTWLLACAGPKDRSDGDSIPDDSAPDDSWIDDTGEPPVGELVPEVCGDETDNDLDGEVDEAECVVDYLIDPGGVTALSVLEVASADPTFASAYGVGLDMRDGMTPSWSVEVGIWDLDSAQDQRVVVNANLDVSNSGAQVPMLQFYTVTEGSQMEPRATLRAEDGSLNLMQVALYPNGDWSDAAVLTAAYDGIAYGIHGVPDADGELEQTATVRITAPDVAPELGDALTILPDRDGDGVPEWVVAQPGTENMEDPQSHVFIFDGGLRGDVTTADADADLTVDSYAQPVQLRAAGDLDGDGTEDLFYWSRYNSVVWVPGPMTTRPLWDGESARLYGSEMTSFDVDGDGHLDLVCTHFMNEDGTWLIYGPLAQVNYTTDDATLLMPLEDIEPEDIAVVDAGGDGVWELLIGDGNFQGRGDDGSVLVAILPLDVR